MIASVMPSCCGLMPASSGALLLPTEGIELVPGAHSSTNVVDKFLSVVQTSVALRMYMRLERDQPAFQAGASSAIGCDGVAHHRLTAGVGALVSAPLVHRIRFGTVLGLGPVTGFVASAVLASTIWLPSPLVAGLGWFLLGIGPIQWTISTTTLRQLVTPAGLLGRVSAINITSYGARPLGAAIGTGVGAMAGAEASLLVAAGLFLAQMVMVLVSPLVRLDERPAMAA